MLEGEPVNGANPDLRKAVYWPLVQSVMEQTWFVLGQAWVCDLGYGGDCSAVGDASEMRSYLEVHDCLC